MTMKSLNSEIRRAVEAAQDKQAVDITVLKLSGTGAFADYFLICTAQSQPQLRAIGDAIEARLERDGVRLAHREGKSSAEWELLDFGYIVVHIFSEQARQFYDVRAALATWRARRYSSAASSG